MRTDLQMAVAKAREQSVQWSTPEATLAKALAALRLMLTAMVVLAVLTANAFAYTGVELECIAQAHAMTPHGFYEVKLITWEVPHTIEDKVADNWFIVLETRDGPRGFACWHLKDGRVFVGENDDAAFSALRYSHRLQ